MARYRLLLVLLFSLLGCSPSEKSGEELPDYREAPQFKMTDSSGDPFSFRDTDGQVRIVSFFFTRCPSVCPKIQNHLLSILQKNEKSRDLLVLSLSVDPENDSPEVLNEYGKKYWAQIGGHGTDPQTRWKFLTGPTDTLEDLLQNGFALAPGMLPDRHNTRLVLIDRKGRVRGFYQGMDAEQIEQLTKDLNSLLR
jgi:protein SCO1/2